VLPAAEPTLPRTLVLTGHFPPEPGGVQTFTYELVRRLPPDRVLVVAPYHPQAWRFDRALPFPWCGPRAATAPFEP
jgi:phosphatidylinositol alpha-1,6-mannosyltransferase